MSSCQVASVRKLIPVSAVSATAGRCRSDQYAACPVYVQHYGGEPVSADSCPLLRESLVQYCAASAVPKFVPYSESMLSRCGSGAFRYCELYLDLARAAVDSSSAADELKVPAGLLYSTNHWWIDLPADGPWHLGLDSFLARLLGPVERLSYLTMQGAARPAIAVSVNGLDLQLVFPERLTIRGCNLYLRSDAHRLSADPYAMGWLFEGVASKQESAELRELLMDAETANRHIEADSARLRIRLETRAGSMGDGGLFQTGLIGALDRDEASRVFNEFCSPLA